MSSPQDEASLWQRAQALAGTTFAELAAACSEPIPTQPGRAKGLVGTLLERSLGASAGSGATADFPELGIELKTLPVDAAGRPKESTFVSSVPRTGLESLDWPHSSTCAKLRRVLWVPVQADPTLPWSERRVGRARLWSPNAAEEALLRSDWEELIGQLLLYGGESIQAHHGQALQLRPKAGRGDARQLRADASDGLQWAQPKAFYLRARFTRSLL